MKPLTILMCIACLLMMTGYASGKKKRGKNVMDIRDMRQIMTPDASPDPDLPHHKYHDVAVYRTMAKGNSYLVYFYSNCGDSLFCYNATWSTKEDLDRASYAWANDTLAYVRLFSTGSKNEVKFQVFGNRSADGKKVSGIR